MRNYLIVFLVITAAIYAENVKAQRNWSPDHVYYGSGGELSYTPDSLGNTIPDFSHVGYKYGDEAIPEIDTKVEVNPVAGDDLATIQAAINSVSAMPLDANGYRGAVLLKAGSYEVSGQIVINTGGIVLRGEGQTDQGTVIIATGTDKRDLIKADNGASRNIDSSTETTINEDYVPIGRKFVVLSSAANFAVGDDIVLYRPGTTQWISDIKMDQITANDGETQWTPLAYSFYFERKITKISSDTVFFRNPIVMAMEEKYGGGKVYKYSFSRLQHIGIENLCLKSAYASEDDENHSWKAIAYYSVENSWIRNVTSWYFAFGCVSLERNSKLNTVLNCHHKESKSIITGGRRYSFNLSGSLALFKDCSTTEGRHDYVTDSRVCGPNVFTNCTAANTHADIGPHHRWAMGTLYDLIISDGEIIVQDRDDMGTGHGWAGANQVFWNCAGSAAVCQSPWASALNYNFGFQGDKSFGYRAGRPDGVWVGHNKSNIFPSSLYSAQLDQRINNTSIFSAYNNLVAVNETSFVMTFTKPVNTASIIKKNFNVSGTAGIENKIFELNIVSENKVQFTFSDLGELATGSTIIIDAQGVTSADSEQLSGLTSSIFVVSNSNSNTSEFLKEYTEAETSDFAYDLENGTYDTLVLITSGGVYDINQVRVYNSTVIMGKQGLANKPIIKNTANTSSSNTMFSVQDSGTRDTITFINLEFDGSGATVAPSVVRSFSENHLVVKDCYVHNVTNASGVFRMDKAGTSVDMQNTLLENCLQRAIGFTTTGAVYGDINISNCTFAGFSGGNVVHFRSSGGVYAKGNNVTLNHCTFYNLAKDLIYYNAPDITGTVSVTNSIFELVTGNLKADIIDYNYLAGMATPPSGTNTVTTIPIFADATNHDFTLTNATDMRAANNEIVGDKRWYTQLATGINVTSSGAVNTIDANNGTLQIIATVTPATAEQNVVWSLVQAEDADTASISATGLLTAIRNGNVSVMATTKDGTNLTDVMDITISNQIVEQSIKEYTDTEVSSFAHDLAAGTYDTLVLTTSGGVYDINYVRIYKTTVIIGKEGLAKKPILRNTANTSSSAAIFSIRDAGVRDTISFINLEFDGSGATAPPSVIRSLDNHHIVIKDCYIHDINNTGGVFRMDGAGTSFDMQNTMVENCLQRVIGLSKQVVYGDVNIANCTFANITAGYVIHFASSAGVYAKGNNVNVSQCTFYDIAAHPFFYNASDMAGTVSVTNSIFEQVSGNLKADVIDYNYLAGITTPPTGTNTITTAPIFADATIHDFTLKNASELHGSDNKILGDKRWYPDLATGISISSVGAVSVIDENNGTLQMIATVTPTTAEQNVVWSLVQAEDADTASISASGLLTALRNGSVSVKATTKNGTDISDIMEITLSNQIVEPTTIEISDAMINTNNLAVQLSIAATTPSDADKSVSWSIESNDADTATITANGLLTPIRNGKVMVKAVSTVAGVSLSAIKELTITGQLIEFVGIEITSANTISTDDGILTLTANVLPTDANNKNIIWSIESLDTDTASINGSVLTAIRNGKVTVRATSDEDITIYKEMDVVISNQEIALEGIEVTGADIVTNAGTSQMTAKFTPLDAENVEVIWSLSSAADSMCANISELGLLTGIANGTVTVIASSAAVDTIAGEAEITISGQTILVSEVIVSSEDNANKISINGGTLQLTANVHPANATNNIVEWSTDNENIATISAHGLVQAINNGSVKAIATATDGSQISDSIELTITNQTVGLDNKVVQELNVYPNPVNNVLYVRSLDNAAKVEIISGNGAVIDVTNEVNESNSIDVSSLHSGLYIIRALISNNVYKASFVKN